MAQQTYDLGPVCPIYKGDWSAKATYETLNMVRHGTALWVMTAKTYTVGSTPSDSSTFWKKAAQDGVIGYGSCSTAAGTAAKVVACTGFALVTGSRITVRFTVTNTAASPTLNVNGTGAKAIRYRNAAITAGYLAANRTYDFVYDGTYYQLVGDVDTNTTYTAATTVPKPAGTAAEGTSTKYAREDHVHPAQTAVSGNAGTATKLATARTIDGVSFNGSVDITHYGTCATAAGTVAKVVACTGFALVTGSRITVRFTVTNTAASPTLNVNGTGAKAIRYRNAAITAGYLAANRTYDFIYDGTYFQLIGDIDTNTTYAVATQAKNGLLSAADKTKLDGLASSGIMDVNYKSYKDYSLNANFTMPFDGLAVIFVTGSGWGHIKLFVNGTEVSRARMYGEDDANPCDSPSAFVRAGIVVQGQISGGSRISGTVRCFPGA